MTVKVTFDQLHIALAAVAGLLLLRVLWDSWQKGRLRKRLAELEGQKQAVANGTKESEYRIERYDVLWFPAVVSSPTQKKVVQVKTGVPHCMACVLPLTMKGDSSWSCAKCAKRFQSSLIDVMVTDSINSQAVKYFLDRNKGYAAS